MQSNVPRSPASIANIFPTLAPVTAAARADVESTFDEMLAHFASRAMAARLQERRAAGQWGWWNAHACSAQGLRERIEAATSGADFDPVNVMALCAMVAMRELVLDPPAPDVAAGAAIPPYVMHKAAK